MKKTTGEKKIGFYLVMAAAVLSILPMAIMFAIFQKGIVRAVSMSGVKG